MGLEAYELLMEIEEEFGLKIEDQDAGKIETIGQLQSYLVERLGETASSKEVWERISRILVNHHRVPPEEIRPEAFFVADLGFD